MTTEQQIAHIKSAVAQSLTTGNDDALKIVLARLTEPPHEMTCASRLWPKNTVLRVTERHNGLSVVVVVDDWGPGRAPTANGVIIDLSPAAFEVLAGLELGHAEVTVEVVDKP